MNNKDSYSQCEIYYIYNNFDSCSIHCILQSVHYFWGKDRAFTEDAWLQYVFISLFVIFFAAFCMRFGKPKRRIRWVKNSIKLCPQWKYVRGKQQMMWYLFYGDIPYARRWDIFLLHVDNASLNPAQSPC